MYYWVVLLGYLPFGMLGRGKVFLIAMGTPCCYGFVFCWWGEGGRQLLSSCVM